MTLKSSEMWVVVRWLLASKHTFLLFATDPLDNIHFVKKVTEK